MMFVQITKHEMPHYNGIVYAVEELDNEYYKVLTRIVAKSQTGRWGERQVSADAIKKDICTVLNLEYKDYISGLIKRNVGLFSFILGLPESCLFVEKEF